MAVIDIGLAHPGPHRLTPEPRWLATRVTVLCSVPGSSYSVRTIRTAAAFSSRLSRRVAGLPGDYSSAYLHPCFQGQQPPGFPERFKTHTRLVTRISHEAIYQSLFIQGRGALKRELVACLRIGRALRVPRARTQNKPQGHVTADVVISKRPTEAADRAVPGHWEGDLIIGSGRSAIATLVERKSRSGMLG